MIQFDFSQIKDAENGMLIPSFTGTIKKVFDQKSDVGQYGPWWLQNIILQDDHANEITVTWCCEDAWAAKDEGKRLLFESGHDKKEQLCGIKKEIRNKNGKTYESVKVDDRAKITPVEPSLGGGGENTQKPVQAASSPSQNLPTHAPQASLARPMSKDEYWQRKLEHEIARETHITRMHSQSMALEVLKLKVALNELTVEDLTPAKLRSLADYFDQDVRITSIKMDVLGATQ